MTDLFFGIDAGQDAIAICAIDESGAVRGEVSCGSSPPEVIDALNELGISDDCVIGIEAGGCGTQLTRRLRERGFNVRYLDARYVHGFLHITQNKTDRNDARGIAEVARLGPAKIPDVLVKSEAIQMLRSELVLRHRLMGQRIALENALRGTFRLNGGRLSRAFSGAHLERMVSAELARLKALGIDIYELVEPVVTLLVALRTTIEKYNRRIARRAADLDVCARFMAIPGVGSICAMSFYTAVEDPLRFASSGDIGPYFGLVPRVSQSGNSLRSGRISRMGNSMTRTHLVSAAKSMMQQADKDSDLRRWAMKIAERSGRGKARVALARKLGIVMIAIWKSGASFRAERTALAKESA